MKLLDADLNMENLYLKKDAKTGLIAIIAIHNTKMGPALGGCRFVPYPSVDAAMLDAIKLATAMTYKSTMAGLPLGGGKSVIISHSGISDRKKLFEVFGHFVDELNGLYITASDSGTNEEDMRVIATRTTHVTSINKRNETNDDTAYMTAAGLVKAMEAAVHFKLGKSQLEGVRVAIQGLGSVGYILAQMLLAKGAELSVCDVNQTLLEQVNRKIKVKTVAVDQIMQIEADVFSPCALGGIIDYAAIAKINAPIICGAANNQLAEAAIDEVLFKKGILFVPDYIANAGGVICAAAQAGVISKEVSYQKVDNIYASVMNILQTSADLAIPTSALANSLAEKQFMSEQA